MDDQKPLHKRLKTLFLGKAHNPFDPRIFHKLSLIAILAWIGLGVDALSSSNYGPQEAFLALGQHTALALIVAVFITLTIFIISTTYSQVVELFPGGGGGYLVASKLLSPTFGMISGCALLVDYVLTITVSIAAGADAIFSFLPPALHPYKLLFAVLCLLFLIFLNMRGVKESVMPLVPVFLLFIVTHAFAIGYAIITHLAKVPVVAQSTLSDFSATSMQLGLVGMLLLILHAYSMGAGTYTGIEAVSNAMPLLRDPKVRTAKKTMSYMAISLGIVVIGLMTCYLLYGVVLEPGKTLNASLFGQITGPWGTLGKVFLFLALLSEAAILFVAAQTGFLGGPRILSNMALDKWLPANFSGLSDRLVNERGILIMGGFALFMMVLTGGSVTFLVVLYSITVFISFVLTHFGLVRHWWKARRIGHWKRKMAVSLIGLGLTGFILLSVIILKFYEGGWITLLILGVIILVVSAIKRHYRKTKAAINRLDNLLMVIDSEEKLKQIGIIKNPEPNLEFDPQAKTAIILVKRFNGIGIKSIGNIFQTFGTSFKNFVFVEVGIIDAGVFKGVEQLKYLKSDTKDDVQRYIQLVRRYGYYATGVPAVSTDFVDKMERLVPGLLRRYPGAVIFAGQIVFPDDNAFTRQLHNYHVFALQRRFYLRGIPFVILPVKV
ncbi:MAG: APC family permease [Nanoarchaeota archaeon]